MPIIYADVLIALNWLIDYFLLSSVAVWLRIPVRRWRVVVAALFGGGCACLIFLPPLPLLAQVGIDIAVAAVMVLAAFPFHGVIAVGKRTVLLFLISASFSGIVAALSRVTTADFLAVGNGQIYAAVSPLGLAGCAAISYGAIRLYERITRKTIPSGGEYRLRVEDGSGVYEGRALYDTGLHLREPFSGAPVVLVEKAALQPILSQELEAALSSSGGERVRMIPYRSVGGNGLLPAFCPKRVGLRRVGERERDITGVYVAVTETLGRGEYEALVGNDLT